MYVTKKHYLCSVKFKKLIIMEVNEKERELIEALRNYRKAFPNGQKNLEIYIMDLVYELMED